MSTISQGAAERDDAGTDAQVAVLVPRTSAREKTLRIVIPIITILLVVVAWQAIVSINHIPKYILPGPGDVAVSLSTDWPILLPALWVTLQITVSALILALLGGVAIAVVLVQSRWIELAVYPLTVILQVTPIVAIAPLLLIYAPNTQVALLIFAFLVAFFPILSNMV